MTIYSIQEELVAALNLAFEKIECEFQSNFITIRLGSSQVRITFTENQSYHKQNKPERIFLGNKPFIAEVTRTGARNSDLLNCISENLEKCCLIHGICPMPRCTIL